MFLGLKFVIPCRSVDSILADYTRISQDFLPYCFFMSTKTLAFSTIHVTDKPMQTVKLNARNGSKTYKLVRLILREIVMNIRDKVQISRTTLGITIPECVCWTELVQVWGAALGRSG